MRRWFSSIWSLWELSDGRIVVSDRENHRIAVFSPAGKYLGSFGQRGDGPGELDANVVRLFVLPGDTVAVQRQRVGLHARERRFRASL